MRKKILLISLLALALAVTGCTDGSSSDGVSESFYDSSSSDTLNMSASSTDDYEDAEDDMSSGEVADDTDAADKNSKLVYESTVRIDTLEFDSACEKFDDLVSKYDGFLETRSIEDDRGYSTYLYDDDKKVHHTLTATVRIPSVKYSDFMSETSDIGDVRSSTENVTNMTQTYGTLQAQLEIYQQEYDSYLKMMDAATDDATMLSIREDLTEISVQIATIKSQMSTIDTDVAYSTIDITIAEVEEYVSERDSTTFFSRLKNTVQDSWKGLKSFLEGILFFVILYWYVVVFLIFIIWLALNIIGWLNGRVASKVEQERNLEMQRYNPPIYVAKDDAVGKDDIDENIDTQDK